MEKCKEPALRFIYHDKSQCQLNQTKQKTRDWDPCSLCVAETLIPLDIHLHFLSLEVLGDTIPVVPALMTFSIYSCRNISKYWSSHSNQFPCASSIHMPSDSVVSPAWRKLQGKIILNQKLVYWSCTWNTIQYHHTKLTKRKPVVTLLNFLIQWD